MPLRKCCSTTEHEPHHERCPLSLSCTFGWAPCSSCRIESVCAATFGPGRPKCVRELQDDTAKRINQVIGVARGPLREGEPVTMDSDGNFRPMRSDHFPDDDPMLPSGSGYFPLQQHSDEPATRWQWAVFWFLLGALNTAVWVLIFTE